MIKKILIALLLCITVSCTRTKDVSMLPRPEVTSMCNFIVAIHNCGLFLENLDELKLVLKIACQSAHFETTDIAIESISKDVFLYGVYAEKGYAGLYVDMLAKSCVLEFYSEGNTYDYAEFVSAFMIPFNIISNPEILEITYTDLIR